MKQIFMFFSLSQYSQDQGVNDFIVLAVAISVVGALFFIVRAVRSTGSKLRHLFGQALWLLISLSAVHVFYPITLLSASGFGNVFGIVFGLIFCLGAIMIIAFAWTELFHIVNESAQDNFEKVVKYNIRGTFLGSIKSVTQVDLGRRRIFGTFWTLLIALALFGWEWYHLTVIALSLLESIALLVFFYRYIALYLVNKPVEQMRGYHYCLKHLMLAAIIVLVLLHSTKMFGILASSLVFILLISVDDIVKGFFHFNQRILQIQAEKLESEHRWLISVPLVLAVGLLGGLGVLSTFRSDLVDATVWIEISGAVIVYLLIRPILEATHVRMVQEMSGILSAEFQEKMESPPFQVYQMIEETFFKPKKAEPTKPGMRRALWNMRTYLAGGSQREAANVQQKIDEESRAVGEYFSSLALPLALTCFIGFLVFDIIRPIVVARGFDSLANIFLAFLSIILSRYLLRIGQRDYLITKEIFQPAERFFYVMTGVIGVMPTVVLGVLTYIQLRLPTLYNPSFFMALQLICWEALLIVVLPVQLVLIQALSYVRFTLNSMVEDLSLVLPKNVMKRYRQQV